jgi:DNA repair exonuclease SbcCD ATPase subunit
MKQLNIKYAAASNFLCFGPEGVEFEFDKMGSIVHVTGEHLDIVDEDGRPASNGCGKSTIPDLISYALTGKTVKPGLKHDEIINNREQKRLYTEVMVDDYRIVRTRKPDSLKVWKSPEGEWTDETEITKGGIPATQKLIDEQLGLTQTTLANLIFFTDDNRGCFLECDTKTKREMVENMLGLERYREYCENAKKRKKLLQSRVKNLTKEYEYATAQADAAQARLAQNQAQEAVWKKTKQQELAVLVKGIKSKETELQGSDSGAALKRYHQAQEEIRRLTDELTESEQKKIKVEEVLGNIKEKLDESREKRRPALDLVADAQGKVNEAQTTLDRNQKTLDDIKAKVSAAVCPTCNGKVGSDNFRAVSAKAANEIDAAKSVVQSHRAKLEAAKKEVAAIDEAIGKLNVLVNQAQGNLVPLQTKIGDARRRIAELGQVKEPKAGADQLLLESQIEDLKKQAVAKLAEIEGPSPFAVIIESDIKEVEVRTAEVVTKRGAVAKAEADLPYYDYFIKAFGDSGIRRFVVRDILPALNNRIAYWLQFLMENRLTLKFDDEFEATIERNPADGRQFVYHALSRGQQRRLNLAVQQSFAHIMMLACGTSPSFIFLDEVSTNIDPAGIPCVYQMICELAKDKQVFVTSHDRDLQQLLDGCDVIHFQMKDGITTRKK